MTKDFVRMYHKNLDETIEVPPSAVHVHARSGWVPVKEKGKYRRARMKGWAKAHVGILVGIAGLVVGVVGIILTVAR